VFKKVSETPEWKEFLTKNALNDTFGPTEVVNKYIAEDTERAKAVFTYAGWLLK
jgi:tripartite-type tricarboxylate transporter receptor subunit TctC